MEIKIQSLDLIEQAAIQFAQAMQGRTVFAFYGNMGAGKTTFIRALCQQLGVTDTITSPTFAIVNEYASTRPAPENRVFHFDFYRIQNVGDALAIGLDDYLYSGHVCLIEWPEIIEDFLPDDAVRVDITVQDDGQRLITMN